jgi:hypothetical protein
MSDVKHTPGPWHLDKEHDGEYTMIGEPIAIVGGEETGESVRFTVGRTCDYGPHGNDQTEANARLIAAAPELLEACRMLRLQFSDDGTARYSLVSAREAVAAANVAIAKATAGN